MKILIIEDDFDTVEFLKTALTSESFILDIAYEGNKGLHLAKTNKYDLILLDYSLPNKNGLVICEEIRDFGSKVYIIFLTVNNMVIQKVKALERGADDYITKPFSFDELRARIRALARRPYNMLNSVMRVDDLILDTEKQSVFRKNMPVYLTKKEYGLLEYLMRNKGCILSRGMIMEHVWNAESDPFSNTVEAHILNLRRKVNEFSYKNLIKNIPGRGYIIDS